MEYKGIKFDAVVATPGCGKSYLCDKYPQYFVDVDEVRLRCKYIVPEDITREELEASKGNRKFDRRASHSEYIKDLFVKLDKYVKDGKTLIVSPHPEAIEYLINNNIKYCFVFAGLSAKQQIIKRLKDRGNPEETIKSNVMMFDYFYKQNLKESDSAVHYEFGAEEYLEDILKKFRFQF